MTPVLDLHGVSAGYGPFHALFEVSMTIEPGRAIALLGANGAGKTTLARVASGLISPENGAVLVDGTDMTGAAPHAFARAGIAHAVEGRSVFASLSVEDNLRLSFRRTFGARGVADALGSAYEQFPILAERRAQPAGNLSGGEQRMLSMARVLVEEPKLLIADELSLGLAPIIVESIYQQLYRLREKGTALLIVEQQVTHALDLCDHAVLLDHGTILWEGDPADAAELVATRIFDRG
jgi:branched-chain amino acid transport system ATP-binding protein